MLLPPTAACPPPFCLPTAGPIPGEEINAGESLYCSLVGLRVGHAASGGREHCIRVAEHNPLPLATSQLTGNLREGHPLGSEIGGKPIPCDHGDHETVLRAGRWLSWKWSPWVDANTDWPLRTHARTIPQLHVL